MKSVRGFIASFTPLGQALGDRAYRAFAGANLVSFIGIWMQRLIFGLAMWDATHSGAWLGLLAICDFAPALLLAPVGGVLGDRMDPARLILACQAVFTLNALFAGLYVALVASPSAGALIGLALIAASATTLSDAARLSIIARIAPKEALSASVAISSISFNVARFVGPGLGGLAYSIAGPSSGLWAAAVLNAPFLWVLWRAKHPPREASAGRNWVAELAEGVRYVVNHAMLGRAFLLFAAACVFVRPAYELMPGLVDALYRGGAGHAAGLIAAIGVGALVAALGLSRLSDPAALGRVVMRGVVASALALIAMALSPWLWLAYGFALLLGYFISTSANGALILSQTQADMAFQARAASLWAMVVRAGPALGALIIGALADRSGFLWPVLVGAGLCLASAWLIARLVKA